MYQNGRGVPQSFEEGARFYRASAEQGFPPAQYMLGLMYDKGQGVPQDYVLAYMWVMLGVAGDSPEKAADLDPRQGCDRNKDVVGTTKLGATPCVGETDAARAEFMALAMVAQSG